MYHLLLLLIIMIKAFLRSAITLIFIAIKIVLIAITFSFLGFSLATFFTN